MSSTSSKIFGILTLVAVVCIALLLVFQWAEMQHYSATPSVWRAPPAAG